MSKYNIQFNDAEREQVYAKIALAGASGSGKTVSALKLAYGLTGGDWSKIAIADTENKRSLVYRGTTHTGIEIGKFKHAPISAPYETEKFIAIIDTAIAIGAEVLIIDSMSHQWEGLGGLLNETEDAGGKFWDFKAPKKKHLSLKEKLQQSPIHIIVTLRTKQEYAVIPGGGKNGANGVQKLGMKPVQEDNFDYEFLIALHLDENNEAKATKDNTGIFRGDEIRVEAEHGMKLREFIVEGKEVKSVGEEKEEQKARFNELLEWIKVVRVKTEKSQAWFIQKEVQYGDFNTWSLADLENLYALVNKPKEEPKETPQEQPKQEETAKETPAEEKPSVDRQALMDEVNEIKQNVPEVVTLYGDYMGRLKKVEMTELTDKQLENMHGMLQIRAKTIKKEQAKGA